MVDASWWKEVKIHNASLLIDHGCSIFRALVANATLRAGLFFSLNSDKRIFGPLIYQKRMNRAYMQHKSIVLVIYHVAGPRRSISFMQHCGYRMLCVDLLLVDSRIKGEKVHHVLIEVHAYYILCRQGCTGKSGGPV